MTCNSYSYKRGVRGFYQESQKSFVSYIHMNDCLPKYTTQQFTYFIYYRVQDKFKDPKIIKIQEVYQKIHTNQFLLLYLNCFSFEFKATRETRLI